MTLATDMMFDIGVVDISHATDAEFLFWQPILQWLEAHTCREEVDSQFVATR